MSYNEIALLCYKSPSLTCFQKHCCLTKIKRLRETRKLARAGRTVCYYAVFIATRFIDIEVLLCQRTVDEPLKELKPNLYSLGQVNACPF